jgi:hypothetical protein
MVQGNRGRHGRIGLKLDERGLALVEFAIVLPLLILILAGLFEFGRLIQHRHAIVKSVGDATRYLAHISPESVQCPAGGGAGNIVNAEEMDRARNLVVYGSTAAIPPEIVSYLAPGDISVVVDCLDNSSGSYRGREELAVIRVLAQTEYQDFGWLDFIGLGPITFAVTHQQLHIGD